MIKIEIQCDPEHLDSHLLALGYQRFTLLENGARLTPAVGVDGSLTIGEIMRGGGTNDDRGRAETHPNVETSPGVAAGARVLGKPKPGHRQRTKTEIEEDEKFFAAQQRQSAPVETIVSEKTAAAINPQDEADERAESDAGKSDKLTLDDVRLAVERYSAAHGVPAAIENIPKMLGRGVAELPDDQAVLRAAIDKIDWETAQPKDAPKQETAKSNGTAIAMREDVVAAMKRYALKYDGQCTDLTKVPHTTTDVMATLKKTFGDKVTKLSEIPATPEGYGAAFAAITEALEKNTFGRTAKS